MLRCNRSGRRHIPSNGVSHKGKIMDLEDRVKQLEEKLGRLEAIVGEPVIGGPGRTVQASLFQLTDDAGKVLAELKREYDSVSLELGDGQDKSRSRLSASKYGPMLTLDRLDCPGSVHITVDDKGHQRMLFHNQAKPVFSLDTTADMLGMIMCDAQHRPRISLGFDLNGHPHFILRGTDSQPRVSIGTPDDKTFLISFLDGQSKPRAVLSVEEAADARLFLWKPDGKGSVVLSASDNMHGVEVCDAEVIPRLRLALDKDGLPGIFLTNEEGKVRVGLYSDDAHHGLRVFDSHEKGRVSVTVDADENPWIMLSDANQETRVKICLMPDDSGSISLYHKGGQTRLTLSTLHGSPTLLVTDENSKPRAILTLDKDKSSLVLLDEDGEPTFEAP
jgi:hypothetical protein